jgi:thymidylate kinase
VQAATEPTRLIVLRGNSGSGKSSVAAEIRARMLDSLRCDHPGPAHFYYLDVPFEETIRRHATRPQASEFGRDEMHSWYRERDLLPGRIERLIPQPVHLTPLPAWS